MSDLPLGRLGPVSGRGGDVRVTLTDLSFRQTSKGRRFAYGEFGPDFIVALHDSLPRPRRRGLLRKLACPACDGSLDGVAVEQVTVTTDVALRRIPSIHVDLEMPGRRCPRCGDAVVMLEERDLESDLSNAVIEAFDSAEVKPG